ncbi:integrase [Azospirillum fermentarium]|uniref:tyrosine-type recombinase/integrase n=1 Tax=Azospirillum fermentarium TaxID=1233114 RepID=UPI002227F27C|nr:site-specific integrase [Azospirillum fermentarium]MCW2248321.1 integrase [Azospirillum fermentarium]
MATVKKRTWTSATGTKGEGWQVRYTDQFGKDRSKSFDRKKEAEEFAATVTIQVKQGLHIPNSQSVTVREAAEVWLEAVKNGRNGRPPAEESTLGQYRSHIDNHIVPFLGGVRLTQLTTPQVAYFRDELLRNGRSRVMTRKILTSLKGMLNEAMTRGMIGANTALPVKIINSGREDSKVVIPSKAEVRALVSVLARWATGDFPAARNKAGLSRHKWFDLFIRTTIATGCRSSEIRGLPWAAFDAASGTVEIVQRADEKGDIGTPKSKAGYRTLYLPSELVRDLKAWQVLCPPGKLGLVFPNASGRVESLANIVNRWWGPLQREAGVVEVDPATGKKTARYGGMHVLRHFRASILIEAGADIKEVQKAMGHSSAHVTLDVYGHLFEDDDAIRRRKAMAEAANRAVFGD